MKIPYVLSPDTRAAYATSALMKASANEAARKIVADNLEWDEGKTPPPLSLLAAQTLAKNFDRINPIGIILRKDVDILMDLYPADISLTHSVPLIQDELYWKRCFEERFPSLKELGPTFWKGKYLSTYLGEYLENSNPDIFIPEEAADLAELLSPYIFFLKINQLLMVTQPKPPVPRTPDEVIDTCEYSVEKLYHHIPLEPVLKKLLLLEEISIVFGVNNLEEKYDPRYFEFSIEDCESLCKGLENLEHLKIIRIIKSNLDCLKVKYILERFLKIKTLEELDFSHCKIGDYGMKALGGFIMLHENLKRVSVVNNRFGDVGVHGVAYALQMQPAAPIEVLDFSLNPMSFSCATSFATALVRCREKPKVLKVNGCGFKGPSAEKMAGLLALNRSLQKLEMCSNDFSGDAEEVLVRALIRNRNILEIDLRCSKISDETQAQIDEILQRNKEMVGESREPSEEMPPFYLNEPEYLIWQYNPNNPDYIPGRYPERIPEI